MTLESYLCLGGVEVVNSNRAFSYVKSQIGNPFTVDFGDGIHRCNAMDDIAGQAYVSPTVDDAPWYQVGNAASGDFLGVSANRVELMPTGSRGVTPRGYEAAIVGRMRPRQRVLMVEGAMYATNARGMFYGERWLADVLRGTYCDECAADEAIILPYCPIDGEDPDLVFRRLARVGLVDGPVFTPVPIRGCHVQEVAFQLAASWPYVMTEPDERYDGTLASGTGTVVSVQAPEWVGDVTIKLQVTALGESTVFFRAVPVPPEADCPYEGENAVRVSVVLHRDDVLIVDSSIERAVIIDATSKQEISALSRMTIHEGLTPWVQIPPCSRVCFHFGSESGPGSAAFVVSTITREP